MWPYWIVHDVGGKRQVFIAYGSGEILARMRAALSGFTGEFVEAHVLDAKTERRIPKAMMGRALTGKEAAALLKKLG